jgi:hypothetical protein
MLVAPMLQAVDSEASSGFIFRSLIWLLSQPLFWAALPMPLTAIKIDPTNLRPTVQILFGFAFWAGCVVLGTFMFFRGLRALRLNRYIRNVPRSTARAAALGPVEMCGKAVGPYILVPPRSTLECLCYWLITETKTVEHMCAPLYLDDGTGTVMVSPQALDMSLIPGLLQPGVYGAILPGETIFVLGSLQENPWTREKDDPNRDELSRIGPGFVSKAEADVLKTAASPLYYSSEEYDVPKRDFDLFPPKILMKGNGPFVISERSQRDVLSDLKWTMYGGIWFGPLLALLAMMMLVMFASGWMHALLD